MKPMQKHSSYSFLLSFPSVCMVQNISLVAIDDETNRCTYSIEVAVPDDYREKFEIQVDPRLTPLEVSLPDDVAQHLEKDE